MFLCLFICYFNVWVVIYVSPCLVAVLTVWILINFVKFYHSYISLAPGGGTPRNSLCGCVARLSKSWPYFRPKNVIFHTRFQTRPLKFIPVFRPGLKLLKLERKQNNSSNAFRIRIFLCRSYSSGIETITTFIRSRSSLENHTRFQTKMGKVCTCFQTKKAQKPYPLERHILIWLT